MFFWPLKIRHSIGFVKSVSSFFVPKQAVGYWGGFGVTLGVVFGYGVNKKGPNLQQVWPQVADGAKHRIGLELFDGALDDAHSLQHLVFGDGEWGRKTDDVSVGWFSDQAVFFQG